MAVVLNTTVPSSQLKKKHNAIAYHRVREAIAAGIVRFVHIPSAENFADCLTKPLPIQQFERTVFPTLFRELRPTNTENPIPHIDQHDTTLVATTGSIELGGDTKDTSMGGIQQTQNVIT